MQSQDKVICKTEALAEEHYKDYRLDQTEIISSNRVKKPWAAHNAAILFESEDFQFDSHRVKLNAATQPKRKLKYRLVAVPLQFVLKMHYKL